MYIGSGHVRSFASAKCAVGVLRATTGGGSAIHVGHAVNRSPRTSPAVEGCGVDGGLMARMALKRDVVLGLRKSLEFSRKNQHDNQGDNENDLEVLLAVVKLSGRREICCRIWQISRQCWFKDSWVKKRKLQQKGYQILSGRSRRYMESRKRPHSTLCTNYKRDTHEVGIKQATFISASSALK